VRYSTAAAAVMVGISASRDAMLGPPPVVEQEGRAMQAKTTVAIRMDFFIMVSLDLFLKTIGLVYKERGGNPPRSRTFSK